MDGGAGLGCPPLEEGCGYYDWGLQRGVEGLDQPRSNALVPHNNIPVIFAGISWLRKSTGLHPHAGGSQPTVKTYPDIFTGG